MKSEQFIRITAIDFRSTCSGGFSRRCAKRRKRFTLRITSAEADGTGLMRRSASAEADGTILHFFILFVMRCITSAEADGTGIGLAYCCQSRRVRVVSLRMAMVQLLSGVRVRVMGVKVTICAVRV